MSNPIEELYKKNNKDPLEGIDIQVEYDLIQERRSKLSRKQRDRVVWVKETIDQDKKVKACISQLIKEKAKLQDMKKNKPR